MTDTFKNAFAGVKSGWVKLDSKRKRTLMIITVSIIILGTTLGISGTRVEYSILFTNLELQDAGTIVGDLDAKKIPYKLENEGRTILIDKKRLDSYRMELAMNDMLPDSTTGFEIFDNTGLMVTEEDRQIMYQRALTGELQRTISSLEGINSAKVHLVLPQKSIFETTARPASASVLLDVKPGHKLSDNAIRGIASLVSGAVDYLPIENIQVIDSAGTLLSGILTQSGNHGDMGSIDSFSSARNSFESEVEEKIISLLGGAYGYDKVKVSVTAQLDLNAEECTIISYYDPVIRSEQVAAVGGDLDAQLISGGNIDDNISNVIDTNNGDQSSYTRVVNNELTTETRNIIKAPGRVEKLTASIVFNGSLLEQDRTNIQSIVAAAIGYDGERGDLISVVGVDYAYQNGNIGADPGGIPAEGPKTFFEAYKTPIMIGGGAVGFLLVAILSILLISKKRKADKEDRDFIRNLENGTKVDEIFDEIVVKPDQKGSKAQKYAQDHPELAAELIKSWVRE
jgi:flagellar M-ring protein FliF